MSSTGISVCGGVASLRYHSRRYSRSCAISSFLRPGDLGGQLRDIRMPGAGEGDGGHADRGLLVRRHHVMARRMPAKTRRI